MNATLASIKPTNPLLRTHPSEIAAPGAKAIADVPALSEIQHLQQQMNRWVSNYHTVPSRIVGKTPAAREDALRLETRILADSLTYLELKGKQLNRPPISERFVMDFIRQVCAGHINFNRAVGTGSRMLKLPVPPDFTEWIHQHPKFRHDFILRTELDLFINRGNFNWCTCDRSGFQTFIHDSSQTKLSETASINCWEAMLYSLLRSDAIRRDDLSHIYRSDKKFHEILESLSQAFRWETRKYVMDLAVYQKAAQFNPYFITVSPKGCKYLGGAGA